MIELRHHRCADLGNRSMLAQLATFHAPDDLLIAVCASAYRRESWDWVKWLPHHQHPSKVDAVGPARLFATSACRWR